MHEHLKAVIKIIVLIYLIDPTVKKLDLFHL